MTDVVAERLDCGDLLGLAARGRARPNAPLAATLQQVVAFERWPASGSRHRHGRRVAFSRTFRAGDRPG